MAPLPTGLWANVHDLDRPESPNAVQALQAASYMLWALTGRRWGGIHQITEEYVCRNGVPWSAGWNVSLEQIQGALDYMRVVHQDSTWGDVPGQGVLFLRNRPVHGIVSMRRLDGEVLDPLSYAVYDRAFIAPARSSCCDPCFDPCCLEVTYNWGSPPPPMGRIAAVDLANQFVNSVECPDECTLPERISSVSRQGVNYQVFDAQDFLTDGRMGVYSADVFIKAVNPMKAQKRARVFSPDMPQARSKTWPTPRVEHYERRR